MKRQTRSTAGTIIRGGKNIPPRNTPYDVYIEGHWYTPMSPVPSITPSLTPSITPSVTPSVAANETIQKNFTAYNVPWSMKYASVNQSIYITLLGNEAFKLDTNTNIVSSVPVGGTELVYDADNNKLYFQTGANVISQYTPSTDTLESSPTPIDLAGTGSGIEYSPYTQKLYAPQFGNSVISVVDPATLTVSSTISGVDFFTQKGFYCPLNNYIYFYAVSKIQVVSDSNGVGTTITPTYQLTLGGVYCPSNQMMYFSTTDEIISVNPTNNQIVAHIAIPNNSGPSNLAYCSSTGKIYYQQAESGTLRVIDPSTDTIVQTITLGTNLRDVIYNSSTDRVYVLDGGVIIDGETGQRDACIWVIDPHNSSPNPTPSITPSISITPTPTPSAPPDLSQYTKLLMHMNGTNGSTTFIDATGNHSPSSVSGASITNSLGPCGPGSVSGRMDGAGSRVEITTSSDFDFGSGDFTIEGWVYADFSASDVQNQGIMNRGDDSTSMYIVYNSADNVENPYCISYYDQQLGTIHGTTPIGSAEGGSGWVHFAVSRSGDNVRLFVNGSLEGTLVLEPATAILPYTYGKVCLGASEFGGYTAHMNLDEFRILKGYAAYTSPFVVPDRCTSPFLPADPA